MIIHMNGTFFYLEHVIRLIILCALLLNIFQALLE